MQYFQYAIFPTFKIFNKNIANIRAYPFPKQLIWSTFNMRRSNDTVMYSVCIVSIKITQIAAIFFPIYFTLNIFFFALKNRWSAYFFIEKKRSKKNFTSYHWKKKYGISHRSIFLNKFIIINYFSQWLQNFWDDDNNVDQLLGNLNLPFS